MCDAFVSGLRWGAGSERGEYTGKACGVTFAVFDRDHVVTQVGFHCSTQETRLPAIYDPDDCRLLLALNLDEHGKLSCGAADGVCRDEPSASRHRDQLLSPARLDNSTP